MIYHEEHEGHEEAGEKVRLPVTDQRIKMNVIHSRVLALEAAHIKWHQAGGPDVEENGIALCALHHKLFDRGAFTVSPELRIEVSDRAHGTHGFDEWLYAFHGKSLTPPQRPNFYPEPEFVQWHVRDVFQDVSR